MDREDIKMLVKKWWDIYNDESLDFKGENPVSEEETFSKSSIMASMPEPTISYIPAPTAAWVLTNKKRELLEVSIFAENTYMKLLNICDLINIVRSISTSSWNLKECITFVLIVYQELLLRDLHVLHVYSECDVYACISLSPFPTLLFFSLILEHSVCDDMFTLALDTIRLLHKYVQLSANLISYLIFALFSFQKVKCIKIIIKFIQSIQEKNLHMYELIVW